MTKYLIKIMEVHLLKDGEDIAVMYREDTTQDIVVSTESSLDKVDLKMLDYIMSVIDKTEKEVEDL